MAPSSSRTTMCISSAVSPLFATEYAEVLGIASKLEAYAHAAKAVASAGQTETCNELPNTPGKRARNVSVPPGVTDAKCTSFLTKRPVPEVVALRLPVNARTTRNELPYCKNCAAG